MKYYFTHIKNAIILRKKKKKRKEHMLGRTEP